MTREEQIIKKASKYANDSNNIIEWGDGWEDYNDYDQVFDAFKIGAKWADENPQFSKEEFIDEACRWLNKYASDYAFSIYDEDDACSVSMDLVDDFKEAMEQLWNEKKQ